jgi:GNAT superfamily N-acetyltransferase
MASPRTPKILVTYMSVSSPAAAALVMAPEPNVMVIRERLGRSEYLDLYSRIGGPYKWDQRRNMDQEELSAFLGGSNCTIFVLRDHNNRRLGMCEFDTTDPKNLQLMNFGILPDAYGRKIGRYLLASSVCEIWHVHDPLRVWLHTDTWDHPNALQTYLAVGFTSDAEQLEDPENF